MNKLSGKPSEEAAEDGVTLRVVETEAGADVVEEVVAEEVVVDLLMNLRNRHQTLPSPCPSPASRLLLAASPRAPTPERR